MDLLEQIAAAGVVGCGGAGFPTHVKLRGRFDYLIVNGAECEPLLGGDRYLMRRRAAEIVQTARETADRLGISRVVVALKAHYHREIDALTEAVREQGADVSLCRLESFYPAGDEQTVVYEATGRVVPPGGLPGQVGAVVCNAATICAVREAMEGQPLIHRYLTVAGAVNRPAVVRAPVGTSFRQCLALAGGPAREDAVVVAGGPMMGRIVPAGELDRAVVTKTTSGILLLPEMEYRSEADLGRILRQARSACIQCSLCTQLCPRRLLGHPLEPHRIMRRTAAADPGEDLTGDPVVHSALLCCECGVCEVYACPMGLAPRRINAALKRKLAAAGVRCQGMEGGDPSPERDLRKVPAEKIAARAGAYAYCRQELADLICAEPESVSIPLRMHIGAPAQPVVEPGDRVEEGQLIARIPEGALGAAVHASIAGRVASVDERIAIVKE